jgi:hypothetical protein
LRIYDFISKDLRISGSVPRNNVVFNADFVIGLLIFAFNVILFGDLLPTGIFCRRRLCPAQLRANALLANRPIRKCRSQSARAGRGIDLTDGRLEVSFSLKLPVIASLNRRNLEPPLAGFCRN